MLHVNESLCCTPEITQYYMKIIFQLKIVKKVSLFPDYWFKKYFFNI